MPDFTGKVSTMQNTSNATVSMLRQDQYQNLVVSQGLPSYVDLNINDLLYYGNTGTSAGIAPVNDVPTTVTGATLFNSSSSVSLMIMQFAQYLDDGVASIGNSLWAGVSTAEESTAPTEITGLVTGGLGHGGTPVGLLDNTITLGTAIPWVCVKSDLGLADGADGRALVVNDMAGMFIVPPKGTFNLQTWNEGAGTSPLYGYSLIWAELVLSRG